MTNIAILVDNLYEDLEVWYSKIFLEAEGAKVTIAGREKKTYRGKNGYPIDAHLRIADLKPEKFDAVIIPGGFAPDYLRRYPETLEFVRGMHRAKKVVAAICHAGSVLISAKLVRGRKLTGYAAIHDDLKNAGARVYPDKSVVIDKNLITSRSPADLPFFCTAIKEALTMTLPVIARSEATKQSLAKKQKK